VAGLRGDSGAACPRTMGGSPPVAGAAAAPLPRTRRQAVPAATFPQRRASTDADEREAAGVDGDGDVAHAPVTGRLPRRR